MLSYKESGISLLERDKDEEIWQYGQGILFTVTVVTTIGKSKRAELSIQIVVLLQMLFERHKVCPISLLGYLEFCITAPLLA